MGLLASMDYLRRGGIPVSGKRFHGYDLVMYESYWHNRRKLTLGGESIRGGRVAITVNSNMMVCQTLARGLGFYELPLYMGGCDGLMRVWPQHERRRSYEAWMVTHKDLHRTARVRAVIEWLVETFAETSA